MEIIIIGLLIALNGVFAMSEIAIVASRSVRLQHLANEGKHGASVALQLANEPNHFLSTVQVGITLVGILAGTFGGAALAEDAAVQIETFEVLAPYSETLAVAGIVILLTYFSLIIGELVPKRLAMQNPEAIATRIAVPMRWLSIVTKPIVSFLSFSTHLVLKLFRVDMTKEQEVTEAEIIALMEQGKQTGVFAAVEHEIVERVFDLDVNTVLSVMTPRTEVVWIDIEEPLEEIKRQIIANVHSFFPVCRGEADHVIGTLRATDLLIEILAARPLDLKTLVKQPVFLPKTTSVSKALEIFKETGIHIAIVISEYGGMEGIVTINDVLEELVGTIDIDEPEFIKREDGSWLVDGLLPIHKVIDIFPDFHFPATEEGSYSTLAGFIMSRLERVPDLADGFEWDNLLFEIVDMDGKRIDKVMIKPVPKDNSDLKPD